MNVHVVYESIYGNTHAIADAIAEGARAGGANVSVRPAGSAGRPTEADLLVVGGPTHMHGLTSSMSRKQAIQAGEEDEHPIDPSANPQYGLRSWLKSVAGGGVRAAAFDTRGDANAALTGSAARGIARRLRHHGYEIVDRQSFLVDDAEGPLAEGEIDRAREWGKRLVAEKTGS
jgi:flavodoxin